MSKTTVEIGYLHSRLKNDLLENQPWWPVTVKSTSTGFKLTVDPVLYRSSMESYVNDDMSKLEHHDVPGIRLEYLLTSATKNLKGSAEGACTVTIANSGTWDATATFTWPDATTSVIPLVQEGLLGKAYSPGSGIPAMHSPNYYGYSGAAPYPVCITLQELADLIDTFTKTDGAFATETPSGKTWDPHPTTLNSGTLYNTPTYTDISATANWLGTSPETNAQVAATVFMPMAKNVNQLSRDITGATVDITIRNNDTLPDGGTMGTNDIPTPATGSTRGTTRYDPDPEGADTASIKYAFANHFGDHAAGSYYSGMLQETQFETPTITNGAALETLGYTKCADTSVSPNPKWRYRMCLAMFLRDGVYTISGGGALIPYTYDPRREIGGETAIRPRSISNGCYLGGSGIYGTWQPSTRAASTPVANTHAWSMINPGLDFVQGPLSSAATGWNNTEEFYHWGMIGKYWDNGFDLMSQGTVQRPFQSIHHLNVKPVPIYAAEVDAGTGAIHVWVDKAEVGSGTGLADASRFRYNPIWIDGVGGELGWDMNAGVININGWWMTEDTTLVVDADSPSGHGYKIIIPTVAPDGTNNFRLSPVTKYTTDLGSATVRQGRPKPEVSVESSLEYSSGHWGRGAGTPGNRNMTPTIFGAQNDLKPGIDLQSLQIQMNGGYGYTWQDWSGDGSQVKHEGHWPIAVNALTITGSLANYRQSNWNEYAPLPAFTGGVGMVIPAMKPDDGRVTQRSTGGVWANFERDTWLTRGVQLTLFSDMDQATGRHAWNYIKPQDSGGNTWAAGRNRPWPPRDRCGTMVTSTPSMISLSANYSDTAIALYDDDPLAWDEHDKIGLREWGASPIYADIELKAYIPMENDRITKLWFERGNHRGTKLGFRSFKQHETAVITAQFRGTENGWGHYPVGSSAAGTVTTDIAYGSDTNVTVRAYNYDYTHANPWWWAGQATWFEDSGVSAAYIADGKTMPFSGKRTGWGNASDHVGTGGSETDFSEGVHVLRFAFHQEGLTFVEDGKTKGTDSASAGPVYGFTFENGALYRSNFANRAGAWNDISNATGNSPAIDTISVREIPTKKMLPFVAETITYNVADAVKYRSLTVTGLSVGSAVTIRASICTPGSTTSTWDGFGQGPGTPLEDFTNMDLAWSGGEGTLDLTALPASIFTTGFTIRFEWDIYTIEDSDSMPIDWDNLPAITKWVIDYDIKPTATVAVTGETYAGDTTPPIDTRVGHIVSYRISGNTTDADRKVTHLKIDFGDGTISDWLTITTPATTVTYDINHSYATSGSGLNVKVKSKDDMGNESDWSAATTVNVANAPPVAILRATPSLIRAGQPTRLDGSKSFDVEDGGSVTNFTFTAGDGSTAVGPQPTNYVDHTYATAGEYLATMTCEDAGGTASNTAQAVIKVLPARHVIPLVLNTMPSAFDRTRSAEYTSTQVLDANYPEVSDTGNRTDEFTLSGMFLTGTADADIAFMEDLMITGHLVEFEYQAVNYTGTASSKTFTGRITSFTYEREGGNHGQTPWTATLVREAGVGE